MNRFAASLKKILRESILVYWGLLKILVPVMIVVEALIRAGLVEKISILTEPMMAIFGLPAATSLVLATNLLVGLYPAVAVLLTLAPDMALSTADMTVLGGMIVFAHALPVEQLIVKKTGISLIFSSLIRLVAMVIYGLIFHYFYTAFDLFSGPANILIAPDAVTTDNSWTGWAIASAQSLFMIFWILAGLIALLKVLEVVGITKWLMAALTPLLRLIGIGPNAAPLAVVGILLGLSFGGGLIMREVDKGHLNPKSVLIAMIFLGLSHSLIEDTLIVMALGADWSGVLLGRIILTLALIIPISYAVRHMPDRYFNFVYRKKKQPAAI